MTGALSARVRAAADVLIGPTDASSAGDLLELLLVSLREDADDQRLWLLLTCLATAMPDADLLRATGRVVRTRPPGEALEHLLSTTLPVARRWGRADETVTVLSGRVLVDVHQSATSDMHRGIQRVVRSLLPRWHARHDVVPVAWTPQQGLLRTLSGAEAGRVLAWGGPAGAGSSGLVVPWRCTVVLAEVPVEAVCGRLAALAESSGNTVTAIAYDTSPITCADLLAPAHVNRFVQYLALVKHLRRVAGISASAAGEFRGFAQMLPAQGLAGPDVVEVHLPDETAVATGRRATGASVLAVGSLEPRKNPLALLHAAEVLWREGHAFTLTVVSAATSGHDPDAMAVVRRLQRKGRDLRLATAISDEELRCAYEQARFTVFCSLHEGYGLPVAESLSLGTPVITTAYGSTREVAEGGGAVLVDPRSDAEVVAAMRSLLTDDARLAELRAQCADRTPRTWEHYADALWDALVEQVAP